jgi:hypothetical protein
MGKLEAAEEAPKVYYIIETEDKQITGIKSLCYRDLGVYIGENIECGISVKKWDAFIPYTSIEIIHRVEVREVGPVKAPDHIETEKYNKEGLY